MPNVVIEQDINIPNLTKLINHLKKVNSRNFSMRRWFSYRPDGLNFYGQPIAQLVAHMEKGNGDCGTVGCIAGHAELLRAAEQEHKTVDHIDADPSWNAQAWLGLTHDQAQYLFKPGTYSSSGGSYTGNSIPENIPLDYSIQVLENLRSTALAGSPVIDWGDVYEFYADDQKAYVT